jgi:hypothetical protein
VTGAGQTARRQWPAPVRRRAEAAGQAAAPHGETPPATRPRGTLVCLRTPLGDLRACGLEITEGPDGPARYSAPLKP